MKLARPTIAEERWLVLAARHPETRDAARTLAGSWHCATVLTRTLLFVLGMMLAGLGRTVIDLLGLPLPNLVAGAALLATAEWLIARRHFHASGIEEALWASGAGLIVVEWLDFGNLGSSTNVLLFAAAMAIVGWRLLNPLFTTLAALLASLALASLHGFTVRRAELASLACFAAAFIALGAGGLRFQRPCSDRMLDWLVIALPPAAYFWSLWDGHRSPTAALLREGQWMVLWPAALLCAFAIAALITGLRRRRHAPLISTLACLVLLAVELRSMTGLAPHWRLVLWGLVGLAAALIIEHLLRTPRHGITSRQPATGNVLQDLLLAGAASAATPVTTPPAGAATVQGQGGEFGGGGASGRF